MNLIVFTRYGQSRHINLAHPLAWGGLTLLALLLAVGLFIGDRKSVV